MSYTFVSSILEFPLTRGKLPINEYIAFFLIVIHDTRKKIKVLKEERSDFGGLLNREVRKVLTDA